jgi:microcystin degradation protein MlrC
MYLTVSVNFEPIAEKILIAKTPGVVAAEPR